MIDSKIFKEKEFHVDFEIIDHKTASIAYLFKAKDKTKIQLKEGFKGGKWVADLKRSYEMNLTDVILDVNNVSYVAKDLFDMITIEKGKKLGVIMDHATTQQNHQKIKNKFFGCNELYIECFYKDEDKEFAKKNYHSYASMSGFIVKECEVEKAIPIHFSRKYNAEEIEELVKQFEDAKRT